jgi:hypothetical protein
MMCAANSFGLADVERLLPIHERWSCGDMFDRHLASIAANEKNEHVFSPAPRRRW